MNYVVGFMFSEDLQQVALIEKLKPEWQKGKLNGIGGKIEPGETPYEAMKREFCEETGKWAINWKFFLHLDWEGQHNIYFYSCKGDLSELKSMEAEQVRIVDVKDIMALNVIPNVKWLIPFALDKDGLIAKVSDPSSAVKNGVTA